MAPELMGESPKNWHWHAIERPGHNTNLREAIIHASNVMISLVQEAATLAPCAELKQAAAVALVIFQTIQAVKDNKEAYKRLGDDSAGLIVAIWRSFKKAESPKEWLSADMREFLVELTHILDHICSFVREKLARNKAMRLIYSRADVGKIAEYRENLNSAMQKFELQSHMNIDLKLGKLSKQILRYRNGEDIKRILEITARASEARDLEEAERINEQELKVVKKISTIEHLKQLEIDHRAEDEREELKKKRKEDRQSAVLERLRAAARAVEMASRLKKAKEGEEEMVELRRKIAAGRRRTTSMPQAQPSKIKRSSTLKEDWAYGWGAYPCGQRCAPQPYLQLENDHQAEDEQQHSEVLKKRSKDRQSNLERLRAAARAVEKANHLKKAEELEEEEMIELRRKIVVGRRRTSMPQPSQAQPSKIKRSSTLKEDWGYGWRAAYRYGRQYTPQPHRQAEDEREHSEELKKRNDRQSNLERLRAAARAMEKANHLKKAKELGEEEMVELRRKIAAAGRRRTTSMHQTQPSKIRRSSTPEEYGWGGYR